MLIRKKNTERYRQDHDLHNDRSIEWKLWRPILPGNLVCSDLLIRLELLYITILIIFWAIILENFLKKEHTSSLQVSKYEVRNYIQSCLNWFSSTCQSWFSSSKSRSKTTCTSLAGLILCCFHRQYLNIFKLKIKFNVERETFCYKKIDLRFFSIFFFFFFPKEMYVPKPL